MKSEQLLIASGVFILVAFVLGVAFGLPNSDGLDAQEIEPVPTADVTGWVTPIADDPMASLTAEQVLGTTDVDADSGASGASSVPSPTAEPTYYDPNVHEHCVESTGRCITLPSDVELTKIIPGVFCMTSECASIPFPVYVYERGTSQIMIDSEGNLHTEGLDNPNQSDFPFFAGANQERYATSFPPWRCSP